MSNDKAQMPNQAQNPKQIQLVIALSIWICAGFPRILDWVGVQSMAGGIQDSA
jgi:hypothetical protein